MSDWLGHSLRYGWEVVVHLVGGTVLALVVYLCVASLVQDTAHVRVGMESVSWDTATGVIVQSYATEKRQSRRGWWRNREYVLRGVHVRYRYTVDDRVRHSRQFSAGGSIHGDDVAGVLDTYPLGKQVTVYFDRKTGASVLEPGVPGIVWRRMVIAGLVLLVCVTVLLSYLLLCWDKRRRRLEQKRFDVPCASDERLARDIASRKAELSRRWAQGR
jgi:hypothetical protein